MYFDERRTHFLQDRLQRRLKECRLDILLRLLPPAHQPRRAKTNWRAAGKPDGQRNQLLPQQGRSSNCFRRPCWKTCCKHKQDRRDWIRSASGARAVPPGRKPYTLAMLVSDALAYYYLRNPLPLDMPLPKPLIPPPWRVEILACDISYSVLRAAQEGIYQREPDGDGGLRLPPALLRQGGRPLCDQEAAEGTGPLRFSQSEDRVPAAAQRRDLLPQRDDVLRRSRSRSG